MFVNTTPDYSLIIPHRNSPELLKRCLDSVPTGWGQVIVVDDNSDPGLIDPQAFAERYPEVEFVFSKRKGAGAGAARNLGLERARGRWLLFADADDFFLEGWTEIVASHRDSDADIIYFGATSVDSVTLQPSDRDKVNKRTLNAFSSLDDQTREIVRYRNWPPWARMFRHSQIELHGIRFEEVQISNDAMFSIQAGYYARKVEADMRPVYCVTTNMDSITFSNASAPKELAYGQFYARMNTFLTSHGKVQFAFSVLSVINRTRRMCGFVGMFRFIGYQFSGGNGRAAWSNIFYWLTHERRKSKIYGL